MDARWFIFVLLFLISFQSHAQMIYVTHNYINQINMSKNEKTITKEQLKSRKFYCFEANRKDYQSQRFCGPKPVELPGFEMLEKTQISAQMDIFARNTCHVFAGWTDSSIAVGKITETAELNNKKTVTYISLPQDAVELTLEEATQLQPEYKKFYKELASNSRNCLLHAKKSDNLIEVASGKARYARAYKNQNDIFVTTYCDGDHIRESILTFKKSPDQKWLELPDIATFEDCD